MIAAMASYSSRIHEALAVAARAHRTQLRKGTDVPYIVHPVQVSMILTAHGFDEDVVIAGLLHDTVEDTAMTLEDIAVRFGPGVAELVASVTEKKEENGQRRPWRVRKEETLRHLAGASPRLAALKAADALHNASATVEDVEQHGPTAWERFNAGPADALWYYREIARLVRERLGATHSLAEELGAVVDRLEAVSAKTGPFSAKAGPFSAPTDP
jgi:(p)ppGpp synthase/HD superfamily hydrolase